MNLYSYIAFNNPHAAKAICHKFGYRVANIKSKDDLAECLRSLVSQEGEPALKEILENHPDKEIILEVYGNNKPDHFLGVDGTGSKNHSSSCSCGKNCHSKSNENYMNADASQNRLATQTNVIIFAAALFLAVAIISKK